MLDDALKEEIRSAYGALLEQRGLRPRWGQRQMIATVANALGRVTAPGGEAEAGLPAVAVVEAGTGTGKTIAYSIAAIPIARARGKRLVVATATVALQEQFVLKDLPDIRAGAGLDFSYALAKGRRRYVCLSKLDRLLGTDSAEATPLALWPEEQLAQGGGEAQRLLYQTMLEALGDGSWDGDRDNWPASLDDEQWAPVTTDHSQCTGRRCPYVSQCSFFQARDSLEQADVIVANHDLVLADLALGGGAILPPPEETIYIFDEGHHLPAKALQHFAAFCRTGSSRQWLLECVRAFGDGVSLLAGPVGAGEILSRCTEGCEEVAASLSLVDEQLATILAELPPADDTASRQHRFAVGEVPEALQVLSRTLAGSCERLHTALLRLEGRLESAVDDNAGDDPELLESWLLAVGGMVARVEAMAELWREYAHIPESEVPPRARWLHWRDGAGGGQFELHCSPILADGILDEHLWLRAAGVVVTSATLAALGRFDRFRLHSGAPENALYQIVASPFDHGRAVLAVPKMRSDPGNATAHTAELIDLLPSLLAQARGTLVLFASRRQMLAVYGELPREIRAGILVQGDFSKQEILRRHRDVLDEGGRSTIFGLASFTEGVDLPGEYCGHVIVAKIPFAVPDSPLEATLSEWVEREGRNAFMEISVPDAALRLVQAAGRLLRTETDTGRITICDRRLLTRRYGRTILDSLPPFRREFG